MTTRMLKEDRAAQLIDVAVQVAVKVGYRSVTRDEVAAAAGVSGCLITRYFGDMAELREQIVKRAVETGNIKILAEALVFKHPFARLIRHKHKAAIDKLLFN